MYYTIHTCILYQRKKAALIMKLRNSTDSTIVMIVQKVIQETPVLYYVYVVATYQKIA